MEILCINLKPSKLAILGGQAAFLQQKTDFFWKRLRLRMLTTNSTLLRPVSLRSQLAIFENKAKKNLHYFRKTLYRRCLTELSIFLEVLNISVFWIWLWFWICEGSEYARVLNITRLDRLLNVSEYPWIIPEYVLISLDNSWRMF